MIRQLCDNLRLMIIGKNLPFAEIVAGMTKAVTYDQPFDGGSEKITIPVSWDTNIDGVPEQSLVPNSTKRGIIYFEEFGCTSQGVNVYGAKYAAQITLVCWYNKQLITSETYAHMQASFIKMLQDSIKVGANPFNNGSFTRVSINLNRVLQQDGSVFSKYSYSEQDRQYLMPPFEHFALDLSMSFTVPSFQCSTVAFPAPTNCQ